MCGPPFRVVVVAVVGYVVTIEVVDAVVVTVVVVGLGDVILQNNVYLPDGDQHRIFLTNLKT